MAAQSIQGQGNIQVLIKDSPQAVVEINGRTAAELWVPKFRKTLDPTRNKDLDLLLAGYAITDLTGRDLLWRECLTWCDRPDPISIRCITGRGGSGKTRFALELLHHVRALPDWDARFVRFALREPFDLWATTHGSNHVLLVFDYAADIATPLAESLRRLADNPPRDPKRRLRILLLARTASWDEGWLSVLKPRSTVEASIVDLFQPIEPIPLEPLNHDDRVTVFAQALKRAAAFARLPEPPLPDPDLFRHQHAEETLRDPLTLMMAAVIGVRSGVPRALSLTRLELAQEAADLLVARRLANAFPENPQLADHMAAYLTMCGGLSKQKAQDALAVEAHENNLGVITNPGSFIDRLQAWLPGEKTDLGVIEPDIVGEAFLLGRQSPRLAHPETTVLRAAASRAQSVITFLIRTIQDVCLAERDAREEPLRWLGLLTEKGEADDFSLLLAIESALPESTVVLRPQAVHVTQLVLERLKAVTRALPSDQESGVPLLAMIARILNNLGLRQGEPGLRQEALTTAQEAVSLYRELVQRNRDAFLASLAISLNNLGNKQSEVGLRQEALTTALEAVSLYQELVQRNRDAFLPGLARSLNNLGNRQSDAGLRREALTTAQEAVSLYRELVQRNRDAFLPDLAISLNNLGGSQSDAGLWQEALTTAQEAVSLYQELVQRNRDAFLPYLAMSLSNLGNSQRGVGLRREALTTAQEAVSLRRELVKRNRDAFLPDLASSLNSLGVTQSAVGLQQEALSTAQEAVSLYQELVQCHRDAFLPDLAVSLSNLGVMQSAVGLQQEALTTAQQAVSLYRELVQGNRDAFLPDLARSLNNLGGRQGEAGLRQEALSTAQEAVALNQELVQRNRDAFLPDLARSLNNLGRSQSNAGLQRDAVTTVQEAVSLRRELVQRDRDAFLPDLARSLNNLGNRQSAAGLQQEALITAQEAVSHCRELVQRDRDAFLPDLAMSLNNLGVMQSAVGIRQEALTTAQEAVSLYRELVQRNPDSFTIDLARSQATLGSALAAMQRFPEAAEAFAIGLRAALPYAERYPQALHGLADSLLKEYTVAVQEADLDVDPELVAEANRILGPDDNQEGESA